MSDGALELSAVKAIEQIPQLSQYVRTRKGTCHKLPAQSLELPFDGREHLVQHPIGHIHAGAGRSFPDTHLGFRANTDLKLLVLVHCAKVAISDDTVNTPY